MGTSRDAIDEMETLTTSDHLVKDWIKNLKETQMDPNMAQNRVQWKTWTRKAEP